MREVLVKTEEFKDSPLGEIPHDWDAVSIDEIAVHVGSGITPRGGSNVYTKEGILFIRSQNVTFSGLLLDDVAYINLRTHESMKRSEIFAHDVLINITGASIGRCCPVPQGLGTTNVNQHVCAIRLFNPNRQDAIFLSSVLASHIGQSQIDRLNAGGNREGLNYQQLRSFIIPFPPPEERACIAEILDTVDKAIARTSSLIIKLKQTKAGLLQDLLTRGLDEDGKLRDPQAHPEQFKDSPLGRIPRDWDVSPLNQEIGIVHGYAFKGEYFADTPPGEVLLVPGNFHREGGLYFDDNNTKFYRGSIPENTVLNNGELLIVMTDLSPKTLILGRVVQLELSFPVLHNQRIGKIVPKLPDTWDKCFLMLVMNSDRIRRNIISNATGTTVRHTSPDRIIANVVPKPNIQEQSKIVQILNTSNTRIRTEEAYLNKLKLQKQGLMQDLLTGKVRLKSIK